MTRYWFCHGDSVDYSPGEITFGSAVATKVRSCHRAPGDWLAGLMELPPHEDPALEHAGVPISIVSKWAGHNDSAFTHKTYVHASDEDLQRGQAALARIHKIV